MYLIHVTFDRRGGSNLTPVPVPQILYFPPTTPPTPPPHTPATSHLSQPLHRDTPHTGVLEALGST